MNKIHIGIDIGKSGAIAILTHDGIITHEMPMIGSELNYSNLYEILESYKEITLYDNIHVVFEKLGVIFGTSKATAFSMGHQSGAVEMVCIALKIPFTKVPAKQWQKQMFVGINEITKQSSSKKSVIRDTKAMALLACKNLFPDLKLTFGNRATKPHDGLIDSILMSEFSRRNYD